MPLLTTAGIVLALAGAAFGQDVAAEGPTAPPHRMHWVDWTLLVLYVLGVLGLGYYYSRKQEDVKEYFTGSGAMNSVLIGISLFATLMSTISYLSYPGEIIAKGPVIVCGLISIPIVYVIVGYLILPVYMKQRVTSAYELLEARLGVGPRLLGAIMFLILRLVWMSVMIYMTTQVLLVVMGIDEAYSTYVSIAFGFIAITYTSMGGMRAVVITDTIQFSLLFLGAILTVALITIKMGGFTWWPTEWASNWDHQPVVPTDIYIRVTVIGSIVQQIVWRVCTSGGDQTAVQRFMSTKDAAAARRSYLVHSIAGVAVLGVLCVVGLALLGYFQAQPHLIPDGQPIEKAADGLFPNYIAHHLPVGVSGLVVAAMFAAAMSSVDSGVNSITAVVMTDFLDRFGLKPKTERGHVLFAQVLAFTIGAIVVIGGSQMDVSRWNFLGLITRTVNLLVAPIFALFFLAVFVKWANGTGAIVGAIYGVVVSILWAYWGPITGSELEPSFQWIGVAGLAANITVGCVISAISRPLRRGATHVLVAVIAVAPLAWAVFYLWQQSKGG